MNSVRLVGTLVLVMMSTVAATIAGDTQTRGGDAGGIVFLCIGDPATNAGFRRFTEAMRARHPQLARRTRIEALQVTNDAAALPAQVRSALQRRPALLVAQNGLQAKAARTVAPQVPLVFASYTDPRELGIASSLLLHPEPTTGLWINDDFNLKRLELLLDAYPQLRVAGAVGDADWYDGIGEDRQRMQALARSRGVELHVLRADSVDHALQLIDSPALAGVQAWCVPRTSVSLDLRVTRHIARQGKPVMASHAPDVDEGAQLSYAYDRSFHAAALADLAARVLSGEHPGTIPIQTPERFQLVVRVSADPRLPRLNPDVVRRADLVLR